MLSEKQSVLSLLFDVTFKSASKDWMLCSLNSVKIRITVPGLAYIHLFIEVTPHVPHLHVYLWRPKALKSTMVCRITLPLPIFVTNHVQLGVILPMHIKTDPHETISRVKKKTTGIFFFILDPQLVLDFDNDIIVQKTPKKWLIILLWNLGGNKGSLAFCAVMTSQENSVLSLRFYQLSAGRKIKALLVSFLFLLMATVPLHLLFSLIFIK